MSCGEIAVSIHTPITDRDPAEIESGAQMHREKRQEGRDGGLATLAFRCGDGGAMGWNMRGLARNYM